MRFLTTAILILIGLVILTGISFFGYQFYQKLHAPAESPFKAIPVNSALVIKLNKPSALWNKSTATNDLWNDLFSIRYISLLKNQISYLDSVIGKDQKSGIAIRHNPLFIVLSQTVSNFYGLLFMINVPSGTSEDDITVFISKTWSSGGKPEKSRYAGSAIYQVNAGKKKEPFFFTLRSGIFIGSIHQLLVKQAIDQLSLNLASQDDPYFLNVVSTSGKNVDASIFVNYEKIAPFMGGIITNGVLGDYLNVSNVAAWTGVDIIQKKDEWLISGYTVCRDTFQYLALFRDQSPQNISMPAVFPGSVTSFTWIGLSHPDLYLQRLSQSKASTSIYKSVNTDLLRMENELRIQLSDYFLPWIGNEMALITCMNSQNSMHKNVYAIFKVSDKALADSLLLELGSLISAPNHKETSNGHKINTMGIPNVIPSIWGNLFQQLIGSAYMFVDDFVIFGNNPESLQEFADQATSEKTLDKSADYLQFSANLSDQSTICYYFNTERSFGDLQSILSDDINKEVNPVIDSLKTFESFGVQIINNGDNFITNVFINHEKEEESRGPLVWQTALDTVISGKPEIIRNALKGEPAIIAFDLASTMYLIDGRGKIDWKLKLPGLPIGDVHPVRIKKNDSVYFLFNTSKHICIVDNNGLFAFNSPFYLPLQAMTGLSCIELPSSGDYHILVPLEDKKVYSFDVYGMQQPGWTKPAMNELASKPVRHLNLQGNDYLFFTSRSGHLLVTDMKGKPLIKPKTKVLFSQRSDFYLNKTNNKGPFLTSSNDGKLTYLQRDGKTSDLTFNKFTPEHIFFYLDINNDKIQEFIYIDLNKLYCYNRFQKLLYDYNFPSPINPPYLIKNTSGEILIAAVSPKTGDVYLFGKKGLLTIDPAIRGNTDFDIGIINPEEGTSLVIGTGKYLRNYSLSE